MERAHVIGQAFVVPHARSHWLMLEVEFRRKRPVAAFGQFVRIVLGMLGSAVGVVPVGNTGGSDVSMFKRMPIAPELQDIIDGGAPPDARRLADVRRCGRGALIGRCSALVHGVR